MRRPVMIALLMLVSVPVWGAPTEGGPTGPGGAEVMCDLPVSLRTKNVGGSDGSGLCVFSSIGHSARYQNERALVDFQKFMRSRPGGGWPDKVSQTIPACAKWAGQPEPRFLQYEGRDASVLEAALKSGRMPAVTYNGHDGVHYRGRIAHMVNLVFLDSQTAAILDNNFVEPDQRSILWMTRQEFLDRWIGGDSGWAVILLSPAPAPVPKP